ncbi:hypothetical protein NDU88_001379 [Pleurodeles waltl]|uniref:Uncharacterized protein n=1 Tax=Pleurodeles waltl TaxID=8319 RepID=A0AAV7SZF3_PLEWA|nr:hypothetical protein NDU88_001379 [Pleurodeles waltl]
MRHQWYLGNNKVEIVTEYKNLGVLLDSNGSFKPHLESLSCKSTLLAFAFNSGKKATGSLTYLPLLKVIQAKLIPTITYGSEILRGSGDGHLDKMITKLFKRLFSLPNYGSPAKVRLELGLVRQSLPRKGAFIKLKVAKEDSLSSFIWVELTSDPTSALCLYLESSLTTLGLEDQLLQLSSHQLGKRATKVSIKSVSHLQGKDVLSKSTHAWLVLSSYGSLIPQPYLEAAINPRTKAAFMKYRIGCLPTCAHLPRLTRINMTDTCR